MTNVQFCDLHPNKEGSLIRGKKEAMTTLVIQTRVKETTKEGKAVTWTREGQIDVCSKCMTEQIYSRAKALDVDISYKEYRLYKDNEGKYHRENRSPEDDEGFATPLAK